LVEPTNPWVIAAAEPKGDLPHGWMSWRPKERAAKRWIILTKHLFGGEETGRALERMSIAPAYAIGAGIHSIRAGRH